jgi:hypothetical protein
MNLQLPMEEVHQDERTMRTEWCPKGRNPTIMEGYQNKNKILWVNEKINRTKE